jgi:hypothetical protein
MRCIQENPSRTFPFIAAYALMCLAFAVRAGDHTPEELLVLGVLVLVFPALLSVQCHYYLRRKAGTALFKRLIAIIAISATTCFFALGWVVTHLFDVSGAVMGGILGGTLTCGVCVAAGAIAEPILDRFRLFVTDRFCKGCGYDLTGNVSGICPECGRSITPRQNEIDIEPAGGAGDRHD